MREKHWMRTVLSFAAETKGKMILSVICALISVGAGLIPYAGVYRIIILFFEGNQNLDDIWFWSGVCAAGYIVKLTFHAISTILAHHSAYSILENMRLKIADKLMEAPLGTVLNQTIGKMKSVIVDRIETLEIPLAHLIPELSVMVALRYREGRSSGSPLPEPSLRMRLSLFWMKQQQA